MYPLHLSCQIYCLELFLVLLYFTFIVCSIYSNASFFIQTINILFSLICFSVRLTIVLLFYWSMQTARFCYFHLFINCFSIPHFIDFTFIFTITFSLLWFSLALFFLASQSKSLDHLWFFIDMNYIYWY